MRKAYNATICVCGHCGHVNVPESVFSICDMLPATAGEIQVKLNASRQWVHLVLKILKLKGFIYKSQNKKTVTYPSGRTATSRIWEIKKGVVFVKRKSNENN